MPDNYQIILNKVEISLQKYRDSLIDIDSNIEPLFDFSINYKNERSVASFVTYQLYEILNSVGMTDVTVLNEMDLRINRDITNQQMNSIEASVDQAFIKARKKKFILDTFATFNTRLNNRVTLFIEYKINDSFKYLQLANDYIKFKHYTINAQTSPYFIYVLIKPNGNGLSITLKSEEADEPKYQMISSSINESDIDHSASVFIYKNEGEDVEILDEALPIVDNIQEKIENFYLLSLENSFEEIRDFSSNLYYSNSGKFGSRVLTAHRIQIKYPQIRMLYTTLKNYQGSIDVPEEAFITLESFKSSNVEDSIFIEKLSFYFNNQIRHQTLDDESIINNAEFNYTRKRALWIQMIIQRFSNNIGENLELIHFYDKKEEEDSAHILQRLESSYRGDYSLNFNQLALGLIHYIVMLYDSIFEVNESKLEYREEYLAYEIKSSMLNSIKKLKKKIGLKSPSIDWNSSILDEGAKILAHIINDI